jgi:hypothetical protein
MTWIIPDDLIEDPDGDRIHIVDPSVGGEINNMTFRRVTGWANKIGGVSGLARLAQLSFLHDLLIAIIPESPALSAPISASRAYQLLLR